MKVLQQLLDTAIVRTSSPPKRIIVCTHAKFSATELCRALASAGIETIFYPVDYSKSTDTLNKLRDLGIHVVEHADEVVPLIKTVDAVIEDGARISKLIKQHRISTKPRFFSVEQTSGGIRFFEENPPSYPVIDVALSPMKLDIENRRATPEGVIRYFSEATGKILGGKEVLVIGFGSIGEGVARLAQTLGAHVTIYDRLATKRMFAKHHGYAIAQQTDLDHILPKQDVVFMATNSYQGLTLGVEQMLLMRDGAVVCNAGSGRGELAIELQALGSHAKHDATVDIAEEGGHLLVKLTKNGAAKTITVLAKGYPINLHLGQGTSHDAIEIIMSLLFLAVLQGPATKKHGLQALNFDIQELVAETYLQDIQPLRAFEPRYVKTHGALQGIDKPYGGIMPFHNDLNNVAHTSVARAWFRTGTKTRGHYHRRSQEAFYAEKGKADIILWPSDRPDNRVIFSMQTGDYLLVPENYFHDVVVTSKDDFECLVIASPPFDAWDQFFKDMKRRSSENAHRGTDTS